MAEGRQSAQWDHTAALLTLTANAHRGRKGRPLRLEDFHPYRRRSDVDRLTPQRLLWLRKSFGGRVTRVKAKPKR